MRDDLDFIIGFFIVILGGLMVFASVYWVLPWLLTNLLFP